MIMRLAHLTGLAVFTLLVSALQGCAGRPEHGFDLPAGLSREAVLERLGTPTRRLGLPAGGERLQYSYQPVGRVAVMVDFDGAGRLVSSRNVLTAGDWARIVPGVWTVSDVEREFGPPALVDRVSSWDGTVLNYRWSDNANLFFWIYLDARGVVQRTQQGMDFENAPDRNG